VVLGAHAEPIARSISLAGEEIVINDDWESGQLSSIQAAIRSLSAAGKPDSKPAGPYETDGLLLCLIDHPLISTALVNDLIEQFYAASCRKIVLPIYEARRGHPVIFPAALYEELLHAPADKGARAVVWAHAADVLGMPTNEEGCVLNLNDPETLHRATGRFD
jgi:molybdenum cofactor cytidylyltransferase